MDYRDGSITAILQPGSFFQEVRILPVSFSGNVLYIKDVSLLSLLIEILLNAYAVPSSTLYSGHHWTLPWWSKVTIFKKQSDHV